VCQLLTAFCLGGLAEKKRLLIKYLKVFYTGMMVFFSATGAEVGLASGLRNPVLPEF
jgi:hypothetical protein